MTSSEASSLVGTSVKGIYAIQQSSRFPLGLRTAKLSPRRAMDSNGGA
jgi:hypothetical protein